MGITSRSRTSGSRRGPAATVRGVCGGFPYPARTECERAVIGLLGGWSGYRVPRLAPDPGGSGGPRGTPSSKWTKSVGARPLWARLASRIISFWPVSNLPLHKIPLGDIKQRVEEQAETVSFSYNDYLKEWDRRRGVARDRWLIAAGVLGSLAAAASFAKSMGWL